MDKIKIEKDIRVFYVQAESFPDGIEAAFKKLDNFIDKHKDRRCFGISRPENNKIIYKAAAEELNKGEAEKLNCKTLVIKKGNYNCITIKDFMKNIEMIGKSFSKLCSTPDIDPDSYCVEWYFNDKDVKCMIRITD